ncbi:DUF2490 domain-containing protein [Flavobacteriaceae bacterium]|mgnify:CR=1 FL=1|jgi:hypothetical protein|nr:DUF2490 domain-containing protein [Flavobacteriaceae bacterium]MDA8877062.1 DUF2490 domain-containing protein [Flavobacteriaceae bacterium]MDA9851330.1 DUF2490 domain-containing protein [Flavobacteriaceae bacterium]
MIKKTLILVLILGSLYPLNAQEYDKVKGIWNATFLDFPLSDKLSFRTELHLRTISYFNTWNQQLFRPQLSYKASKNVSWRGGYTYIKNFDQDVTADPRVRREHNIWEQVQVSIPLKKSSFSTWIRLEHRFQEERPLQKNKSLRSFDFSSRLRFRLTYQKTLSKADAKVLWNLVAYDEIFTIMNPQGIPFKFNQNWTFLGFRFKFSEQLSMVSGFQKNTILKATDQYLKNRLWNTILFYKF